MTTTHPRRDSLYAKLREVLGDDNGDTMIDILEPDGVQLATRDDIHRLEERIGGLDHRIGALEERVGGLEARIDNLDARMERFEDRLWDFHEALRSQTRMFAVTTVSSMLGVGTLFIGALAIMV